MQLESALGLSNVLVLLVPSRLFALLTSLLAQFGVGEQEPLLPSSVIDADGASDVMVPLH